MSKTDRERHHQAALDMLTFHGIDPATVLRDGVYATGYDRIALNEDGERMYVNGDVVTEFIAWPKAFPVMSFFWHYWLWKRAVV